MYRPSTSELALGLRYHRDIFGRDPLPAFGGAL